MNQSLLNKKLSGSLLYVGNKMLGNRLTTGNPITVGVVKEANTFLFISFLNCLILEPKAKNVLKFLIKI